MLLFNRGVYMKINLNTKVNVVPNNDTKVTVFELVFPTKKFDKTDYYNLNIMLNIINNYSLKNRDRNSFIENNELHYISNYNVAEGIIQCKRKPKLSITSVNSQ